MNVVHLNFCDMAGGAARAANRLHQALLSAGVNSTMIVREKESQDRHVFVVTPGDARPNRTLFLETIQRLYIDAQRTEISNTIFSFPYPGISLANHPAIVQADILHLHWVANYQSPVTLNSLFQLGKPIVWTLHDQWPFTGGCHYSAGCTGYMNTCTNCLQLRDDPLSLPAAVLRDKQLLFGKAPLTIVTPSRWMAARAAESALFRQCNIHVIPNCLDTTIYQPTSAVAARTRLGIQPHAVYLLFGAIDGNELRKGFHHLVRAVRRSLDDPRIRSLAESDRLGVLCFGEPHSSVRNLGIPVHTFGNLQSEKEIAQVYAAADIFILPSIEDNLPNTLLEAMACAIPLVAFAAGGIPELLVDGVTGRLAPPEDADALADAIITLVLDPVVRSRMGTEARNHILEKCTQEQVALRHIQLYKQLADGNTHHSVSEKPPSAEESGNVSWDFRMGTEVGALEQALLAFAFSPIIDDLSLRLAEVESDRAARLDVIRRLNVQLRESEADRAARLEVIQRLDAQLRESEADRAARLEATNQLKAERAANNQGIDGWITRFKGRVLQMTASLTRRVVRRVFGKRTKGRT